MSNICIDLLLPRCCVFSLGLSLSFNDQLSTHLQKDPLNKDADFLHEYAADTHDAYISKKHHRYITLSESIFKGQSLPRKARRAVEGSLAPKRSRFLLLDVSESDIKRSEKGESQVVSLTGKADAIGT